MELMEMAIEFSITTIASLVPNFMNDRHVGKFPLLLLSSHSVSMLTLPQVTHSCMTLAGK